MPSFVKVARASEIPPGTGKAVDAGGVSIAVWNRDGNYFATSGVCVHRGGPLGEGDFDGETITCPWHNWQYEVATGKCITNPVASIPTYPVKVEGDDVLVEV